MPAADVLDYPIDAPWTEFASDSGHSIPPFMFYRMTAGTVESG
jgi:hypothetical protein